MKIFVYVFADPWYKESSGRRKPGMEQTMSTLIGNPCTFVEVDFADCTVFDVHEELQDRAPITVDTNTLCPFKKLKECRVALGFTQADAAKMIAMSVSTYSKLERGESSCNASSRARIVRHGLIREAHRQGRHPGKS